MRMRPWGTRRRVRHARILQERDPSLINLPFPIPSIPILGPLLSPLIGGEPWPSATSSQAEMTSSAAQQTPTQAPESSAAAPSTRAPQDSATPAPSPQSLATAPQDSATPAPPPQSSATTPQASPSSDPPSGSSGDSSGSQGTSDGGSSSSNGSESESSGDSSSSSSDATSGSNLGEGGSDTDGESSAGTGGVVGESGGGVGDGGMNSSSPLTATDPANVALGVTASANDSSSLLVSVSAHVATETHPAGPTATAVSAAIDSGVTEDASSLGSGQTPSDVSTLPTGVANVYGGAIVSAYVEGSSASGFIGDSPTGSLFQSAQPAHTGSISPGASSGTSSHPKGPSSGSSGSNGPLSSSTGSSSSVSHHTLSKGAIAAIATVAAVALLLLVFLLLRKHSMAKRMNRQRHWFFGGQTYGSTAISSSRYFRDHPDADTGGLSPSARSSFGTGTSQEHWETCATLASSSANTNRLSTPPALSLTTSREPEMEQIWPSNLSGSIMEPALATTVESDPLPTIRSPDRARWSSDKPYSDETPSTLDGPAIPDSAAISSRSIILPSPMSVRPFTPSEAWQFPKPPQDNAPQSRASIVVVTPDSNPESGASSSEYATAPENPFSDFASVTMSANFSTEDMETRTAESIVSVDTETASHFARVETIRRPFVPTMEDEMPTTPGERVRMLRRFDDGWAYAEKVGTGQRGLIPIDCLRMPEEELPAFLASKRLSSYRGARSPSPLWGVEEPSGGTMVGRAL